ncbi:MAG: LmeA family phospholipid-binding protein [Cyanobacteria bacterium NC_groundwater_1444_Ag_S-0.65um_54_12]|nr:LmeA family phospholipid-binding protein [Cyanobacteria bacterium NC_groundwater_1444_Ag_S-0.65um_54_12]
MLVVLYGLMAATPQLAANLLHDRLRSVLAPAGEVAVQVESDPPIRAVGGAVDRIAVRISHGDFSGMPFESLVLETQPFEYDPVALLINRQLILRTPLAASASLDLTEENLTAAVRSPLVSARLKGLTIPRFGLPGLALSPHVDLIPKQAQLRDGRIELTGQIRVAELGIVLPFVFGTRPTLLATNRLMIADTRIQVLGRNLASDESLGTLLPQFLDLGQIASDSVQLALMTLRITEGRIHLSGQAILWHLP